MTIVSDAWNKLSAELTCVDDEYLKRAFALVWSARGDADKEAAYDRVGEDNGPVRKRIAGLDQPFCD